MLSFSRVPVVLVSLLVVASLSGCDFQRNLLLGGAPERPAPPPGPALSEAPRVPPAGDDIVLSAHDEESAADGMKRRCPDGYAVSFVGSSDGEKCSGPTALYSTRTFGRTSRAYRGPADRGDDAPRSMPRCTPHQRVTVHFRCEEAPPDPSAVATSGDGSR